MTLTPYKQRLDAAWSAAMAPRTADAPTVVSTFAGLGGSSLGYHIAGFDERLVVEWDDNAVAHLRRNFPHVHVYHGDIGALSVDEARQLARVALGELDVLDGSPPCQGFSVIGARAIADPRNQLYKEFARLLAGLAPRAFVMENAAGLVHGKMRATFVEIVRHLEAISPGYNVAVRLLNAQFYGVPQSRRRLIFIGIRRDLGQRASHPVGQTAITTVGDAIDDLDWRDYLSPQRDNTPGSLKRRAFVRRGENMGDALGRDGYKKNSFSICKTSQIEASQTIVKTPNVHGSCIHYRDNRQMTDRELARISSFPDQYELLGTYEDRHARLGNSVPPLFACAIARHVRTLINGRPCV
jgi:DNA (cytosine-5)-methyltransferase 1